MPEAVPAPQAAIDNNQYHPVILVSIDGFRPDYLQRGVSPNLNVLASQGVRAIAMHPSYPSITFPNHYTLVTGLRPDHHGIVGNTMEDRAIPNVVFKLSNHDAVTDRRWWDQAEPVWVTAEKNHVATGIMFWPGSEAAIHGVRPSNYRPFDGNIKPDSRVDTMLGWLDKTGAQRPGFLTVYFDDVDHAGHESGPASAEVNQAVARVDQTIGRMLQGLQARHIRANIVIVSDHGMAEISPARRIFLSRLANPDSYRVVSYGTFAGIEAQPGQEDALALSLLKPQAHMQCWRKEAIPARFHYGQNARVPRFLCMADVGWMIFADEKTDYKGSGAHGYDNLAPEMNALFIANGPQFKPGVVLPVFDNVDVYPLLMTLLHIPALHSDGTITATEPGLIAP
ncbi:MAG: alkaline phosphatase family protein [Burkholderiales bacterium]|nr:alkaline phosphatase family protein [Burkholderiales bacterium]